MSDEAPEVPRTPRWAEVPPRERIRQPYFPAVRLVTHEGKTVRLYEDLIKGNIVVINFFYATCKGICPPATANLLRVQALLKNRVGRDIFMYSFSLKPAEDTPAVLRRYAQRFH